MDMVQQISKARQRRISGRGGIEFWVGGGDFGFNVEYVVGQGR